MATHASAKQSVVPRPSPAPSSRPAIPRPLPRVSVAPAALTSPTARTALSAPTVPAALSAPTGTTQSVVPPAQTAAPQTLLAAVPERSEVRAVLPSEHRESLASIDLELFEEPSPPPPPRLSARTRVSSVAPPLPSAVMRVAPTAAPAEIPDAPPSNRIPSMAISTRDVIEHVQRLTPTPAAPLSFAPPAPQPLLAAVDAFYTAPAAPPAPRLTMTDPTDVLFDAMYDLDLFETAVEGASYCLASLLRALPSRAGMVHLFDAAKGDFVTVYAQGPDSDELLMGRYSDEDWLISAAVCKHRPLVMSYGGEISGRPLDRHARFGAVRSVLVAPVFSWGRCLGIIELVDPTDGSSFDVRAENATSYAADRYGEFLGERGVHVGTVAAPSGIISRA